MKPLPRWRLVAGCLVLLVIAVFAILFTPIYLRNLKLQNYVDGMTHLVETTRQSDEVLIAQILDKAHSLDLPVMADNVHILRSTESLRIEVRYAVIVHTPVYTVALHFYPGAGSR